ncbi:MFS transporter [Arachnia propionica]|uniref:MFS transporter n=1 Tax=Arachnia propionica TaxID=1750 RepID=UPI002430FD72|nr:MFS transporter [Arachnia propionica]
MTCPTTNRRALLTAAGAGMAVSAMMQTLLGNATPRIVDELAAPELYGWVAGSYLVCSTLLLPPFSQYTDRLGTRRVLVAGHACFLTGTLLMSWAPTMPLLLAARAVQGVGAAAITPAVLAALGLSLDASSRARALSRLAIIQLVANLIGPPLGGWFTDGPGWRLGVLTGVPLSLVALLAARSFPTATPPGGWWRITVRGSSPRGAGPGALVWLAAPSGVISIGAITYAPLALQTLHGVDATTTGWFLIPMLLGIGAGTFASGRCAPSTWARPLGWVLGFSGAALAAFPQLVVFLVGITLLGVGVGLVLPLLLLDAQATASEERMARASGMVQFGRNAGAAAGIPALSLWIISGLAAGPALTGLFATLAVLAALGLVVWLTQGGVKERKR